MKEAKKSPKEIRKLRGLPRIVVAVRAGVSEPSVRAYENNPDEGVTDPIKQKLDPVYRALASGF
jgi:transcriptional regulator with XRE-family HTH domain